MADLLGMLGTLGAAGLSSAASVYNNSQNIRYAEDANDAMVSLANTAHQREVRDFEAAGLNPILSASSSGSATPSLRLPSLEGIDGGIGQSAGSLSRALNGLASAEVKSAKADANTAEAFSENAKAISDSETVLQEALANKAKSEAASWIYDGVNSQLDAMARYEAISGNQVDSVSDHIKTKEGWKTYNSLVRQYRNEIETGRYKSSLGRAVFDDIRNGVSSAADLVGAAKGIHSMLPKKERPKRPIVERETHSIDRFNAKGEKVGSERRTRQRSRTR